MAPPHQSNRGRTRGPTILGNQSHQLAHRIRYSLRIIQLDLVLQSNQSYQSIQSHRLLQLIQMAPVDRLLQLVLIGPVNPAVQLLQLLLVFELDRLPFALNRLILVFQLTPSNRSHLEIQSFLVNRLNHSILVIQWGPCAPLVPIQPCAPCDPIAPCVPLAPIRTLASIDSR